MNNSKYNEINIPDNLDERIDEGVKNVKGIEQLELLQLV